MKFRFLRGSFFLSISLSSTLSLAQVGASSSPVLWELNRQKDAPDSLTNGRYLIKKPIEKAAPAKAPRKPASPEAAPEAAQNPPAVQVPAPVEAAKPPEAPIVAEEVEEPSFKEQAQSLFGPNKEKITNFYKEQLHPDDIRNNRLEIQALPALVYNGSSANYSYRSYHSFYTAMDLASNVWVAPSIGLYGRILFSFGASLSGDKTTGSLTPAKYEDMDLGIKFRRFFGMSRAANSVEFGVLYSDSKLIVPNDNLFHPKLISTGLGVKLTSRIPTSANFAWIFGGSFYPRLQHREERAGVNVSSGGSAENTRLSMNFGSEVKFSRESQIVYDLAVSTERNAFDGTANPVDPETGQAPSHVTVTNTFVLFSFGYRWGR